MSLIVLSLTGLDPIDFNIWTKTATTFLISRFVFHRRKKIEFGTTCG